MSGDRMGQTGSGAAPAFADEIERRVFPRFPFHSKAVLTVGGIPCEGELIDLSLSGALFRAGAACLPFARERCLLDILHGARRSVVRAPGEVAYAQGRLIGVKFHPMDAEVLQGLMRIVEMNLGNPELMKRGVDALSAGRGRHGAAAPDCALLQAPGGRARRR